MDIIGEGPATLLGAIQFDVRAPNADSIYRVQVYTPEAAPPPEGYPVVWLTDGAVMFAQAAPHMWFRAGLELRPALLVGVGYPESDRQTNNTRRAYDFTPPTPPGIEPHAGWPTGGIDLFSAFLIDQLRPLVAARWPVDLNDQTLYGHSLGGFFALSIFLKRPGSFKTYVASSPSLWWNKGQLEGQLNAALEAPTSDMLSRRMLLSAGALEETAPEIYPGATPESVAALAAALREVAMVRRAEAMAAKMTRAGIDARFMAFAREGHGSVIGAAVARALEFALGYDPSRF